MRYLLIILLLAGCTKIHEDVTPEHCGYDADLLREAAMNYRPSGNPITKGPKHVRNYHVLYIDFDGEVVNSSNWNGGQTINALPAPLSTQDKNQVISEVSALLAAYRVTITDSEIIYNATTATRRQRIIVTPTSHWIGGVSGVSYIGQMLWGESTPAWVFSDKLYNLPHFIAEIVTHEAGHSMASMRHQSVYNSDCTLQLTYRMGWVMGNSLYVPQGAFGYGNTYSCNAWQDDHQMLTATFGLRP